MAGGNTMMGFKLSTVLTSLVFAPSVLLAAEGWPLSIPIRVTEASREDLSGVLVRMGREVYQASDLGLQRTAEGKIAVAWLQGYDADGVSVRIERTLAGASTLGVAKSVVGVGAGGFLLVGESAGRLSAPDYPCGITRLSTCVARACTKCTDAPACACLDPMGGCDSAQREYCDGSCTNGSCNESNVSCGCIATAPGQQRIDPKAPGKAPALVPYVSPE